MGGNQAILVLHNTEYAVREGI